MASFSLGVNSIRLFAIRNVVENLNLLPTVVWNRQKNGYNVNNIRMISTLPPSTTSIILPTIDLSQSAEIIQPIIYSAIRNVGAFYVMNSFTVEQDEITYKGWIDILKRRLFDGCSIQEKNSISSDSRSGNLRGYIPIGHESGLPEDLFEYKEGYSWGKNHSDKKINHPLCAPNIYPTTTSNSSNDDIDVKNEFDAIYNGIAKVAKSLLPHLSNGLLSPKEYKYNQERKNNKDSDSDFLTELSGRGDDVSLLRAWNYLPTKKKRTKIDENKRESENVIGSSQHTDWGLLTIVCADPVDGLELLIPTGDVENVKDWRRVEKGPEGSLIVNVGDFLANIALQEKLQNTNTYNQSNISSATQPLGHVHSPVHRVTIGSTSRTSLTLFYYPNIETLIDPTNEIYKRPEAGTQKFNSLHLEKNKNEDMEKGEMKRFADVMVEKWKDVSVY